jgi:Holliday junction resolvase RusA-like endonuclease
MGVREEMKLVVYVKPQPQGSSRAFVVNGRAVVTSANKNLKPYRQELTETAKVVMGEREKPFAKKHEPVAVFMVFYLERPESVPKKRREPVVKPDLSKLIRSTEDALTGLMYHDDAQIVRLVCNKYYGSPERVEIVVQILD